MSSTAAAPSLFKRLLCRVMGLIFVMVFAIFAVFYFSFISTVDTLRDRGLHSQAKDIEHHLSLDKNNQLILDLPFSLQKEYKNAHGQYVYLILSEQGDVLFSSGNHTQALNTDFLEMFETADQQMYGATLTKILNHKTYYIQVAQNEKHSDVLVDTLFEEMFKETILYLLMFIFSLLGIITITIRGSLKPILRVSEEAKAITPQTTNIRLSKIKLPAEILPLVTGINSALERLEKGFEQQQEFTANAAHQLRTPLAVLQAHIDNSKDTELAKKLSPDIKRMTRMVSQLLKSAQLENLDASLMDEVDLHTVAVDIASLLAPLGLKQDKFIEVIGTEANHINANKETLYHAIQNLVENALQHTRIQTTVYIDVSKPHQILIKDSGSGISDKDKKSIFKRFWRAPQQSNKTGAGLGLSIVKTIIKQHHGKILVSDAPNGGAIFILRFPKKL